MHSAPNTSTSENTEKSLIRPAGFCWRFFAHLIDLTLLIILIWFLFNFFVRLYSFSDYQWMREWGLTSRPTNQLIVVSMITSFLPLSFLYFMIFEASPLKATPGKMIMGLYIIAKNGEPASFFNILLRTLGRLLCVSSCGLGYLLSGFTRKKRALHDLIGNTTVINYGGIPTSLRGFTAFSALVGFCVTVLYLPPMKLPKHVKSHLSTNSKNLEPENQNSIRNTGQDIPASLILPEREIALNYVYSRIHTHSIKDLKFTEVTYAFFNQQLDIAQEQQLHKISDFFNEAKRRIGLDASFTLSLTLPEDLNSCNSEFIQKIELVLNNKTLEIPSVNNKNTKYQLQPKDFKDKKNFDFTCTNLVAQEASNIKLNTILAYTATAPEIELSINTKATLNAQISLKDSILNQVASAIAFWNPKQELLQLGLYIDQLSINQTKAIIQSKRIRNSSIASPAVYVEFSYPKGQTIFSRDLVSNHTITFFKQFDGPLNFRAGERLVEVQYDQNNRPDSLNGKIGNGERLVGRLIGTKRLDSEEGYYNFKWDIPFNATVIVFDK